MQAEPLTGPIVEHGEGPVYSRRWSGPRFVDMMAGGLAPRCRFRDSPKRNSLAKVTA